MASNIEYIPRRLDLAEKLSSKSHFLFGPRQTGKTSLLNHTLPDARVYDLLHSPTYLELSRNTGLIEQELSDSGHLVVIDEIQRLPNLLNEVQRLIEKRGTRFLLTGSSARSLRRGGINLLGGRARTINLHPLTFIELGSKFELSRAIERGLLPSIYFSDEPSADLDAYTGTYLREEVVAEGLTRNVPAFSRFLTVAALCNSAIVNFTKVANDAQVARTTVYEYFDILRDTMLIHELPAWRKSKKRKPLASSKYYFFDIGVVGALQGRSFKDGTPEFGQAFETWLFHELVCYRDYNGGPAISYWRSTSGFEVDFVLGDHTAIEVKSKATISERDLRCLNALSEENSIRSLVCVARVERARRIGNVDVLPWRSFLKRLWNGDFDGG